MTTSLAQLRGRVRQGRPCQLYRAFDGDELLYVGIAYSVGRRLAQHQESAPWWHRLTRVEVQTYESRGAALAAETLAIRTEYPKYNIKNKSRPELKDLHERTSRR